MADMSYKGPFLLPKVPFCPLPHALAENDTALTADNWPGGSGARGRVGIFAAPDGHNYYFQRGTGPRGDSPG